jgi:hypothetical protein
MELQSTPLPFNRRYATGALAMHLDPWVKTRGYIRHVAARQIPLPAIRLPYLPAGITA